MDIYEAKRLFLQESPRGWTGEKAPSITQIASPVVEDAGATENQLRLLLSKKRQELVHQCIIIGNEKLSAEIISDNASLIA